METKHPPDFLKVFLWSYDIKQMDIYKDIKRIATNVMVYGDTQAVRWLLKTYTKQELRSVLQNPLKGEWDARSLYFWSQFLEVIADEKKALKNLEV